MELHAKEDYHVDLLESLPHKISGSFLNFFMIGCCGRKVGVPKFLLVSVWPQFNRILSGLGSCCEQSEVSIVFPDTTVEALEVIKDLLVYGKVENPDVGVKNEFYDLVDNLGLTWHVENEEISSLCLDDDVDDFEDNVLVGVAKVVHENLNLNTKKAATRIDEEFKGKEINLNCKSSDLHQEFINTVKNKSFENAGVFLNAAFRPSQFCTKYCSRRCSAAIQDWNVNETHNVMNIIKTAAPGQLRQILTTHLKSQKQMEISTSAFYVSGKSFCDSFFANFIGTSEYMVRSVLKNFNQGIEVASHGNKGLLNFHSSTTQAICWIKTFSEAYGQHSPDENLTVLSHWLNKASLFIMYKSETFKPHVSQSQFYLLFKSSFGPNRVDQSLPRVRISKYSSHSVCSTCVALNNHHRQCKNKSEINQALAMKNNHRMIFGHARRKVKEIMQSSSIFPEDHLVLQVDGMDNSKR